MIENRATFDLQFSTLVSNLLLGAKRQTGSVRGED
jgi:hypothetical protein